METLIAVLIFICVAGALRYALESRVWKDDQAGKK
jgi:hypothetical protein